MTTQSTKRKFLASTLTATMVAAAVAPVVGAETTEDKGSFPDVPADHLYAGVIADMANAGVIKGEPDGNFNLGGTITRAEAAQMVAGLLDLNVGKEANKTNFTDVKGDVWYTGAVNSLVEAGVIAGKTDTTFAPNDNITRGELAQLLVVAYGLEDVNVDDVVLPFTDVEEDVWFTKPIKILFSEGLIKGQTETVFGPKDNMKRGDFAWLSANVDYAHGTKLPKPEGVAPSIESVTAISKTTVEVKFSTAVDAVSADNFAIAGGSVSAATLAEDKKTVTLTVSGLAYDTEYKVATTGILVDGNVAEFGEQTFKTPAVTDLWNLVVEPASSTLQANGADNTKVTFKLVDKVTGQPDAEADNIVLSVKTTYGALANERITIQDGVADVLLTSEFSNKNITAKIDAQIIEASGDYNDLIGQVVGSAEVKFVVQDNTVETKTLVGAESNQADRATLFFDQNVTLTDFVKVNEFGNLLYNYDSNGDGKVEVDANGNAIEVTADFVPKNAVAYHALKTDAVVVKQGSKKHLVQGVRPVTGNAKAMEVILANPNVIADQLIDNEKVSVETNINNSINQITKSTADFVLTDARNPEVTAATAEGMNRVVLKFSESVANGDIRIDGLASSDNNLKNTKVNENTVRLGEFNAVTLQDTRDTAWVDLTDNYDWDGPNKKEAIPGYFKAGTHSIQVSNLVDHAFATDSKNKGTTQTLQFVVQEDTKRPTLTAKTESPEQFRAFFDRELRQSTEKLEEVVKLEIYDEESKEWFSVDAPVGTKDAHPDVKKAPKVAVGHVEGGQYVVEVDTDWTEVFNTKDSNKNYYNYKFRLAVDKEQVSNKANGLVNLERLVADLSASGSHLLENDTKSPTIDDIKPTLLNSTYRVLMSEPVKLPGLDNAGETLNQDQSKLPEPTVQFQGKDKDGKAVTFAGVVTGYSDKTTTKADSEFFVEWTANKDGKTPQDIVDDGGSNEWEVIVKSISDDVGNTAATLTKKFEIDKTPERVSEFQITTVNQDGVNDAATADRLILTFTSGVVHTGGSNDATALSQYTLNGKALPTGTSIAVEDRDGQVGNETVIITLPEGYLETTNTITVNKNLVSNTGVKLTGQYEWVATPGTGLAPVEPEVPVTGKTVADYNGQIVQDPIMQTFVLRIPEAELPANTEKVTVTVDGVVYELAYDAGRKIYQNGLIKAASKEAIEKSIVEVTEKTPEAPKTVASVGGAVVQDPILQTFIARIPAAAVPTATANDVLVLTVNGVEYDMAFDAKREIYQNGLIKAASKEEVENATFVIKK